MIEPLNPVKEGQAITRKAIKDFMVKFGCGHTELWGSNPSMKMRAACKSFICSSCWRTSHKKLLANLEAWETARANEYAEQAELAEHNL